VPEDAGCGSTPDLIAKVGAIAPAAPTIAAFWLPVNDDVVARYYMRHPVPNLCNNACTFVTEHNWTSPRVAHCSKISVTNPARAQLDEYFAWARVLKLDLIQNRWIIPFN
jgi:hypothetical protein